MLNHHVHDVTGHVDGDGEADADIPAGTAENRGRYADQAAFYINERAPGIAGIDRGIGLDEILIIGDAKAAPADGAHDAHRHGLTDPEGIADGQNGVADLQGTCYR